MAAVTSDRADLFRKYRHVFTGICNHELRPYITTELMDGISISKEDAANGSPKRGDMIARNPKNHADKWLVAEKYFKDNFEPMT